ncbi:DUF2793 domain-containing protein [Pyruvatibacter sp.]|uniref:DUF2793 domain-containing protein n=1 Tax=Pyruvatibacter sp. TaxID=1981328 RepID=UPI0032EEC8A2
MSETTNLQLPMLEAAQAQKHVTLNESLQALDLLVQLSVADRMSAAPPASPADGTRYIVPQGATGAWAGQDNKLAAFQDGVWVFHTPRDGWRAFVAAEGRTLTYANSQWREPEIMDAFGAGMVARVISEEHTLATASASDTALVIPQQSILMGVTCLVSQEITGATAFDVGIAGDVQRFGTGIGPALNAQLNAAMTPTPYAADTTIRFTATGGPFTAGAVRVAAHVIELRIPDFI